MTRPALLLLAATLLATAPTSPAGDDPKKPGFDRTKAGKARLLKEFGGSEESEEAVMLGLAWLTQAQKPDGGFVYDGRRSADTAPATGMAVLAFLGAGQSHKEGRYKQTVQAGLDWLVKDLGGANGLRDGHFRGAPDMYGQGIATLALCEAYGMTQDAALKAPAQAAVDFIQKAQGGNGSWGYRPRTTGDTSIVGWQVQALHAAKLAGLAVDDQVLARAMKFLDAVGTGQNKAAYGYDTTARAGPGTSLTAVGLLCRYYADGWRATTPGFAEGTAGLLGRAPAPKTRHAFDLYYYYYATQVVRFHGGEAWRDWNEGPKGPDGTRAGGMPDWLIKMQNRAPANRGSWDPEPGWIGRDCGRLGSTALCLLTLEVYYRYAPEQGGPEPKKP